MRAAAVAVAPAEIREGPDRGPATFVVRLSRNSFRWGGSGTLHASGEALHVTARRAGLLGYVRPRETLRIAANRITSVLRESDVIRLQFRREGGGDTAVLEFSAPTVSAAARIVEYLPAAQTVEIEKPATRATGARIPAAPLIFSALLAAILIAGGLLFWPMPEPPPVPPLEKPAAPAAPVRSQSPMQSDPISYKDLETLRAELRAAQARTADLKEHFALDLHELMEGDVSREDFARTLDRALIPRWGREGTERARRADRVAVHARALELMTLSAGSWSLGLTTYASGLRSDDPETVRRAFEMLQNADEFEQQAYALVEDAQARASPTDSRP